MHHTKWVSGICFLAVVGTWLVLGESWTLSWSFQQPTYLLEKETPGLSSYTCDVSKDACKVNFDFTASVPTEEPSTHYSCLIDFWFWETGEERKCNPGTVEFPIGSWDVHLIVKRIADDTIMVDGTLAIVHPDGSIDPLRVTSTREWQSPSYLLLKEDTSLPEYTCDPEEPECKINLKVTALLDGVESSLLTCEITSDFEIVPTSDPCNPNTSIVPTGDHPITIKILDKNNTSLLQTTVIALKNPEKDTTIDPTRVVTDIAWQQPTYLLEKDDITKSEYTCDTEKPECKVNLLATPKLDGAESSQLSCHITTDFGTEEADCNPDTLTVPNGSHTITIETTNKATGMVITTRTIRIQWLPVSTGGGSGGGGGSAVPLPLDFFSVQILVQSGLDESHTCKTEICQVNFTVDVPPGVLCQWDFGWGVFETEGTQNRCNPGYVRFVSDALVSVRITDPNHPTNTVDKTLQVSRTKKAPEPILNDAPTARIELQTKITASKRLTDTGIVCALGKSERCSLNFTGAPSIGAESWHWDFGDGITADKKNPGSHAFPLGKYQVRLLVTRGAMRHTALYDVEVVKDFVQQKECPDCASFPGKLQISATLPNPPHADTVEWIEITNISPVAIPLGACQMHTRTRSFSLSGTIEPNQTLRLRQAMTGLILGNENESLSLTCGEVSVDAFAWNFPVPTGYIIRREVLFGIPEQTIITAVIDGDTVEAIIGGRKTRIRLLGIDTPETVHPTKPVEKFGKEASDFARRRLEGKPVWVTFDAVPVDHYGRRLGYIWECGGSFSEVSCTLFNAEVVMLGYGRMERRFPFYRYAAFDAFEKQAKNAKIGIWSDPDFVQDLDVLSQEEREMLTLEQEMEYLKLQEELLEACAETEAEWCDEKPKWADITGKISTLSVSQKKSWIVRISGRTWWDFPVEVGIYGNGGLVQSFSLTSNEAGEYSIEWIPRVRGDYAIKSTFRRETEFVEKEKTITVETISPHFDTPLSINILLQGQKTPNRWQEGDIFHCRSRGSCSVNVAAESNRTDDVTYLWKFPDGSVSNRKNPTAFPVAYGQYEITLTISDQITGEIVSASMKIDHWAIPKRPKKEAGVAKYTIDLKDVPQDIGGGMAIEAEKSPWKDFVVQLTLLGLIGASVLFYPQAPNTSRK